MLHHRDFDANIETSLHNKPSRTRCYLQQFCLRNQGVFQERRTTHFRTLIYRVCLSMRHFNLWINLLDWFINMYRIIIIIPTSCVNIIPFALLEIYSEENANMCNAIFAMCMKIIIIAS